MTPTPPPPTQTPLPWPTLTPMPTPGVGEMPISLDMDFTALYASQMERGVQGYHSVNSGGAMDTFLTGLLLIIVLYGSYLLVHRFMDER